MKTLSFAIGGGALVPTARSAAGDATSRSWRPIEATDGTRLHVRECGEGRPIVFVAPWALNSSWWSFYSATLGANGWRVIAPDRRGHGGSDAAPRGYDFDTLADDLALVLDRMHVRDAVIVGHSMGAAEVVRYLTRHGAQHAVRAVLIAPTTPFLLRTADNPDGAPRDALARGRDMLRLDFHRRIAAAAPEFFGAPAIDVPAAAIDWWVRTIVDECSLAVMLALHRAMTETDFRPELKSLAIPTLILHGDADTSARLDLTGRRTHELIRGSELKIYPGAAHGIAYTHAERVLSDILAFAG